MTGQQAFITATPHTHPANFDGITEVATWSSKMYASLPCTIQFKQHGSVLHIHNRVSSLGYCWQQVMDRVARRCRCCAQTALLISWSSIAGPWEIARRTSHYEASVFANANPSGVGGAGYWHAAHKGRTQSRDLDNNLTQAVRRWMTRTFDLWSLRVQSRESCPKKEKKNTRYISRKFRSSVNTSQA